MSICYPQVFACKHREANQIKQWRDQLLEGVTGVFGDGPKGAPTPVIYVKTLHAKIGELVLENDASQGLRGPTRPRSLLRCPARSAKRACCRAQKNDRSFSVSRQAIVLEISRCKIR